MKTVNHFYLILIHGGEVILQVFDMYVLQADIDAAVKALLVLKAEYKSATGKDWKPGQAAPVTTTTPAPASAGDQGDILNDKVNAQGNVVRDLKASKASKVTPFCTNKIKNNF